MSYYQREEGGKLVPVEGEVPEEAIRAIERFDEEAIVQRMTTGVARRAFIYDYPIKTATGAKQIIGISTDGADEIARMLGNIEVLPDIHIDKDSDPDYFYAMVRGKDLVRNVTLMGVGRTCKFQLGKGNQPDHDRPNEWAFVSSVSKAQRNVILHHTPEEVVIRIINTWTQQKGRSETIKPPTLQVVEETPTQKPPTAVVPPVTTDMATIAEQQEKLKKLRMEVHNRFQRDLGIGVEERKEKLKTKFGVESLTDLNEQQLKECLSWIEEIIEKKIKAPAKPPVEDKDKHAKELGFENLDEQNRLRGRLYTILTSTNQLNLKAPEAGKFVTDRGYPSSTEIPKDDIIKLIQEANELVKAKETPNEF